MYHGPRYSSALHQERRSCDTLSLQFPGRNKSRVRVLKDSTQKPSKTTFWNHRQRSDTKDVPWIKAPLPPPTQQPRVKKPTKPRLCCCYYWVGLGQPDGGGDSCCTLVKVTAERPSRSPRPRNPGQSTELGARNISGLPILVRTDVREKTSLRGFKDLMDRKTRGPIT